MTAGRTAPTGPGLVAWAVLGLAACGGGSESSDAGRLDLGVEDSGAGDSGADAGVDSGADAGSADRPPLDLGPLSIDGPCRPDQAIGTFLIQSGELYAYVDGTVNDAVIPTTIFEEVSRSGDCVMLRRRNPICDPPCQAGETCNFGGACIPFPRSQDVGRVTVFGLAKPVEIEPIQPGNRYSFTDLPNPCFSPGREIRLRTTEGRYGALALDGRGFAVLEPPSGQWYLEHGRPLAVTWTPDNNGAVVALRLNVDQHGNTPLTLVCQVADTGQYEIAATLVDALLDAGITGFPTGRIIRQTQDSMAVVDGCVELRVESPRTVAVRVEGHVPCDDNQDCPQGQTCDLAENTCR